MFIWNECVGVLTTIISFFFQFIHKLLSTFWRGHIGWIRGKYQFYTICKYSKKKKILLVLSHFFYRLSGVLIMRRFILFDLRTESRVTATPHQQRRVCENITHTHTKTNSISNISIFLYVSHTQSKQCKLLHVSSKQRTRSWPWTPDYWVHTTQIFTIFVLRSCWKKKKQF